MELENQVFDTIVGLIEPQSGEVLFEGKSILEIETQKKYFTYIPHENCLKDSFTIDENIKWLDLNSILDKKVIHKNLKSS